MDIRLPNGRIVRNVPEGTTKAELRAKLETAGIEHGLPSAESSSDPAFDQAYENYPLRKFVTKDTFKSMVDANKSHNERMDAFNTSFSLIPDSVQARLGTAIEAATTDKSWAELSAERLKEIDANQQKHRIASGLGTIGSLATPTGVTGAGMKVRAATKAAEEAVIATQKTAQAAAQAERVKAAQEAAFKAGEKDWMEAGRAIADDVIEAAPRAASGVGTRVAGGLEKAADMLDQSGVLSTAAGHLTGGVVNSANLRRASKLLALGGLTSGAAKADQEDELEEPKYMIPSDAEAHVPAEMEDRPWSAIVNYLNQTDPSWRKQAREEQGQ